MTILSGVALFDLTFLPTIIYMLRNGKDMAHMIMLNIFALATIATILLSPFGLFVWLMLLAIAFSEN